MAGYPAHLTFGSMDNPNNKYVVYGSRSEINDRLRVGEITFVPWVSGDIKALCPAFIKNQFTPEGGADHLTGVIEVDYLFNEQTVRSPAPPRAPAP